MSVIKWSVTPEQLEAAIAKGAERGLALAGEHVLAESNVLVPFKEGELQDSGFVKAKGNQAVVGYDKEYARRQHEDMSLSHKNGKQAKFLETAMNSTKDDVLKIVGDAIGKEVF